MCLTDATQKTHLIADILGDPTWHVIANVFAEVAWVEEEIAAAKARWPEHAAHIDRLFGLRLHCAVLPGHWAEPLARIHIRELARRVVEGKDLRPPTRAEMLYVLSDLSQEAPSAPRPSSSSHACFGRPSPNRPTRCSGMCSPRTSTRCRKRTCRRYRAS